MFSKEPNGWLELVPSLGTCISAASCSLDSLRARGTGICILVQLAPGTPFALAHSLHPLASALCALHVYYRLGLCDDGRRTDYFLSDCCV